jgi:hypothetical protein
VSESSGRWARGLEATLPADAGTPGGPSTVSCASAGTCAAVGSHNDTSNNSQGLVLSATLAPHDTTVTRARIGRRRHTAVFTSTAAGSMAFQRAMVKRKQHERRHTKPKLEFRACTPKSYDHLKHGRYTFEVRGVSSAGAVDPNPAIRKFKI